MRRSLIVVMLLAACGDEGQRKVCTEFARDNLVTHHDPAKWIEQCVKEKWTKRQRECHARTGGGFQSMFCDD
jgi:hypothetical protein